MDFTFKAWSDVVQIYTALFEHVSSCLRQRNLRHYVIYKAVAAKIHQRTLHFIYRSPP